MANDTTVVSFRMPTSTYHTLEEAAQASGKSVAEYIRDALNMTLSGGMPIYPPQNICANAFYVAARFDGTIVNTPPVDPNLVSLTLWRRS